MAKLLSNRSQVTLVENDINHLYFIKFILCGKTDMECEISVSELIPSPNFSSKSRRIGQTFDFDPENIE